MYLALDVVVACRRVRVCGRVRIETHLRGRWLVVWLSVSSPRARFRAGFLAGFPVLLSKGKQCLLVFGAMEVVVIRCIAAIGVA